MCCNAICTLLNYHILDWEGLRRAIFRRVYGHRRWKIDPFTDFSSYKGAIKHWPRRGKASIYIYIQGCHHMGEGDPTSDILKYNSETVILPVLWIIFFAIIYIKHQYLVKNYRITKLTNWKTNYFKNCQQSFSW